MVRGMTGYGRSSREKAGLKVTVEIRTVNHRFADIRLRLPWSLTFAEPDLRRRVAARLKRGRIEISVEVERTEGEAVVVTVNPVLAAGLVDAARALREKFGLAGELDVATVLRFPEAVSARPTQESRGATTVSLVEEALEEAIDGVDTMRRGEGEMIGRDLSRRLDAVSRLRDEIAQRAADFARQAQRRLERRIAELLPSGTPVDAERLEQEVAHLAERADVTEELVRLGGYLEQVRSLLGSGADDAGRRIDFLLQEMNREANTIGSKATDHAVGSRVVDLKLELEKIREQGQNLE